MELETDKQGLIFIEAIGSSMWPFLSPKDRLVFKEFPLRSLRIGDIVLYREDGKLTAHRLVKIAKEQERYLIFARGDNSLSAPENITEQMFLGKAIGILKNGKMISFLNRRYQFINRLIVIIAPIVIVLVKVGKKLLPRGNG